MSRTRIRRVLRLAIKRTQARADRELHAASMAAMRGNHLQERLAELWAIRHVRTVERLRARLEKAVNP